MGGAGLAGEMAFDAGVGLGQGQEVPGITLSHTRVILQKGIIARYQAFITNRT
jgi:hypothetical protein